MDWQCSDFLLGNSKPGAEVRLALTGRMIQVTWNLDLGGRLYWGKEFMHSVTVII